VTELHSCGITRSGERGHQEAIETVDERDDGTFEAGNGEYSSIVNYCPECGKESPAHLRLRMAEMWKGNPA
jgi:hypothetical protein